ncbi:MAG: class I tRNA ligase family protein, partial [Pyrinomonadaceae bacterium]|nr:class I tRNA ligase family protein [Pyrinomonadaceae bacterium]
AGASERPLPDRYVLEHARAFALAPAPASETEPAWDTSIGRGRPGWHIECSAMSMKYLGESFDIHAGGIDLVFPHHENEIAQSEGATGKQFVRHWIHFEHLKVEGETMSKSKGNYYTFRDVAAKGYSPAAVRYFLLSVPYNKQLNFTFDALAGAEKTVGSLRDFRARLIEAKPAAGLNEKLHEAAVRAAAEFEAGMDDDLNTSVALAVIHNLTRDVNTALARKQLLAENQIELLALLDRFDTVLSIFGERPAEMLDSEVQSLIDERQEARRRRDFARADEIRVELAHQGIILEDTKDGLRWKRK